MAPPSRFHYSYATGRFSTKPPLSRNKLLEINDLANRLLRANTRQPLTAQYKWHVRLVRYVTLSNRAAQGSTNLMLAISPGPNSQWGKNAPMIHRPTHANRYMTRRAVSPGNGRANPGAQLLTSRGRGTGFARPQAQRPLGGRELHASRANVGALFIPKRVVTGLAGISGGRECSFQRVQVASF